MVTVYPDYGPVLFFTVGGFLFTLLVVGIAWACRPRNPERDKYLTYECGEDPVGDSRFRFNIRYYYFGILFVLFDVETVFFYPWAVTYKKVLLPGLGMAAFGEMVIFILILVYGLVYAWKKGVLQWD